MKYRRMKRDTDRERERGGERLKGEFSQGRVKAAEKFPSAGHLKALHAISPPLSLFLHPSLSLSPSLPLSIYIYIVHLHSLSPPFHLHCTCVIPFPFHLLLNS